MVHAHAYRDPLQYCTVPVVELEITHAPKLSPGLNQEFTGLDLHPPERDGPLLLWRLRADSSPAQVDPACECSESHVLAKGVGSLRIDLKFALITDELDARHRRARRSPQTIQSQFTPTRAPHLYILGFFLQEDVKISK